MKMSRRGARPFYPLRISIRYKLAVPVLICVSLILLLFFQTTFRTVREMVSDRNETRLMTIGAVFTETLKVPLMLANERVLGANIEWMLKRPDVLLIRVEDLEGNLVGGGKKTEVRLPDSVVKETFFGVQRISQDAYVVVVPIQVSERPLGRVILVFSQLGFEEDLKDIFLEKGMFAFILAIFLAMLTGGVTWLAIRPLFRLKRTAQEILAGDLSARARVHSMDEFEDLGDAFNEMVTRLTKSLDNLRARTEALEESEEKYRLIVENASDIIFTMTVPGELTLLNQGFSGCTREQLLKGGLSFILELHTDDTREKFKEALKTVEETTNPVTNVAVTHTHHGNQSEIFYLVNFTPVMDHEGRVKIIQVVMRDVTEMRRIEMMKESLIRDVAHELKTPTAKFEMALNWFEKEIERRKEEKNYAPIVGILKNNVDRLMRTITSIMDLSRLESGMAQVTKQDLDLNEVLLQVGLDMAPLCRKKNLDLDCRLSNEHLPMSGDHDMLYRLFVNLIGNAIKFTKKGRVSLVSYPADGMCWVEVSDTGLGIAPQDLQVIFDRFVQKTASTQGIGVGLTICRDIAALHEGEIWAQSEGLGKGSTFKVKFPMRTVP